MATTLQEWKLEETVLSIMWFVNLLAGLTDLRTIHLSGKAWFRKFVPIRQCVFAWFGLLLRRRVDPMFGLYLVIAVKLVRHVKTLVVGVGDRMAASQRVTAVPSPQAYCWARLDRV